MTESKNDLSFEEVSSKLSYDPETGLLTWKVKSGPKAAGDIAGCLQNRTAYIGVGLNGRIYKAHRLAWLLYYGDWPVDKIDHRDGCRTNNKIINLRCADDFQNAYNRKIRQDNTSGFKGVSWQKAVGKWQVRISVLGKWHLLGYFANIEEAAARYLQASNDLHSEFGRVA